MATLRVFPVLASFLMAVALQAQVIVTGFTETGNLGRNDDNFSGPVELGFTVNIGGVNFTQTYVSNNGYITFGGGSGDYTPDALNAGYTGLPIIAGFYSDIDTRNPSTGIVTWGTGTVDGRAAFVVKYPNVGEYSNGAGGNSFQIILVSRPDQGAGSFDVFFDYQQITWDHGAAVAGFHNGNSQNPQFYEVPGSMQSGAFLDTGTNSLANLTNAGDLGNYLLQSRGGNLQTPFAVVPEPSTYALLAMGLGWIGVTLYRRRR